MKDFANEHPIITLLIIETIVYGFVDLIKAMREKGKKEEG